MPVVPFIPAVIGGVAAIAGGKIASDASKDAANTQAQAGRDANETQLNMFNRSLELQEPYREAGYNALTGLQGLVTPEGRAKSLASFYASPEYSGMANQAEKSTMRNQSMQGGLRSGSNYAALQNIAPQLGQNYLSNQYNQLTGLANMGMGAASQGASGALSTGAGMANTLGQIGAAQAGGQIGQANAIMSAIQGFGGALGQGFGIASDKGYI